MRSSENEAALGSPGSRVFQTWEKTGIITLNTREGVHILVVEGHGVTVAEKWGKET